MPTVIPYVPQNITVHLGTPNSNAPNVTVPFIDYVKNVASSEIYPTWDESALRANIFAIVSFALNRIYTEFYRSRGYDFDITNSTAFDQAFVNGRSYFESVSRIADELFNDYLRRPSFVEPLAAKFCNGTTVTCEGLSQWGSQNLAQQGYTTDQILRSYYGNVETVTNAPIRGIMSSYPGTPLRVGSTGPNVVVLQTSLNRISQNYPAIPKIPVVDGIFGSKTEAAVKQMQRIFGLTPDGIVGPATWYEIVRLYVAVTRLAELRSQGQKFYSITWQSPDGLQSGNRGERVRQLQYMLSVLSNYIPQIPPLTIDGIFGPNTQAAVISAQRWLGLPETGVVNTETWDEIYDQFSGIENTTLRNIETFPENISVNTSSPGRTAGNIRRSSGNAGKQTNYATTTTMTQFPGTDLVIGAQDPIKPEVVR